MVTSYNNPLNPSETVLSPPERRLVHDDDGRDADQGHRPRSHVAWGAVIAGSLLSISLLVLFSVMAYTFGIPAYRGEEYGVGAAAWSIVTAMLAFFAGGCLTTDMAPKFELRTGLAHGALAWVLAIPLIFLIFGGGIGTFSLGSARILAGADITRTTIVPMAGQTMVQINVGAAWGTLLTLFFGLVAAAIGGWIGATGKLSSLGMRELGTAKKP